MPFGKFFKRSATKSTIPDPFKQETTKTDVEAKIPSAPAPSNPAQVKSDQNDIDRHTAIGTAIDDKIASANDEDTGKGKKQAVNFDDAQPTQVKDNVLLNPSATKSTVGGTKNFLSFWNQTLNYDLEAITFSETNEWTPNALSLFAILAACSQFSTDHHDMIKRHPEFFDYGVACYYAILFYIQILRARRSAGVLTRNESSFLRGFERDHPLNGLPIAGPLEAFFSCIVAHQPADSQYDWIVPRIETANFTATMSAPAYTNGSNLVQPLVPYMLSILRMIIDKDFWSKQRWTETHTANGQDYKFWNDADCFVPAAFLDQHDNHVLWGIRINRTAQVGDAHGFLYSSGLSYPFNGTTDQLALGCKNWWNSNFKNISTVPLAWDTAANGMPANLNTDGTTPINTLENFMFMPKDGNSLWFKKLVSNAVLHAKCFSGATNLSQIPTFGGESSLVLATLKRPRGAAAPNFTGPRLDPTPANIDWYQNAFAGCSATFESSVMEPARQEVLQAMTFAVNASLPAPVPDGQLIGAHTTQRKGEYFTSPPSRKMEYKHDLRNGKPMFEEFESVIQGNFFLERMSGL
jgi:hypothetical protein